LGRIDDPQIAGSQEARRLARLIQTERGAKGLDYVLGCIAINLEKGGAFLTDDPNAAALAKLYGVEAVTSERLAEIVQDAEKQVG
jgi:hypothetical protein